MNIKPLPYIQAGRAYLTPEGLRVYIRTEDRDHSYPFRGSNGLLYSDMGEPYRAEFRLRLIAECPASEQRSPEAQAALEAAPDLRTLIRDALQRSGDYPVVGLKRDDLRKALGD